MLSCATNVPTHALRKEILLKLLSDVLLSIIAAQQVKRLCKNIAYRKICTHIKSQPVIDAIGEVYQASHIGYCNRLLCPVHFGITIEHRLSSTGVGLLHGKGKS